MIEVRTKPIDSDEVPALMRKHIVLSRTAFLRSCTLARQVLDLEPVYHNIGRPVKYSCDQVKALRADAGVLGVAEAAEKHGFSLRTAYWYLKKGRREE